MQQLAQDFVDHPARTTGWVLVRLLCLSLLLSVILNPFDSKSALLAWRLTEGCMSGVVFIYLFLPCLGIRV
jgi:hypothetical protein